VGVATGAELPKSDGYGVEFAAHALDAFLAIGANFAEMILDPKEAGAIQELVRSRFEDATHHRLNEYLLTTPQELAARMPDRWADSWKDFEGLYRAWKAPDIVSFFNDSPANQDLAFAWQRIAGVNPMTLARCTRIPDHFPVRDEHVKQALGADDGLDRALAEGRLFLADYAVLDGIPTGVTDGNKKYLAAPLALFGTDARTGAFRPIAIQTQQTPSDQAPVWTPADGWRWRMAQAAVQIADANVHEGIVHLGRTHMVMEAVYLALHRHLAKRHPLYVLLIAHVETTAAINHSAKTSLIAPGGTVDRCFAPTIEAFSGVVKKALDTYPLDQTDPHRDLKARGLDDPTGLPIHPYRDDVLPVWEAIQTFVGEYVDLYYRSDEDVVGDLELQGFVEELGAHEGGRLKGVPAAGNLEQLKYLLTRLIFIAGPQHSAVNFTQWPNMGFPPNMPGASYQPIVSASTTDEEASFTKMLPPWRIVFEDTTMVYLLSNVRSSKLGYYGPLHFTNPHLLTMLRRYHARLDEVERASEVRDEKRLMSYPYLRPSQILQSISI